MTATARVLVPAAALSALALLLNACPRGLCAGGSCTDLDSGDPPTPDGCVLVNGTCGPSLGCCATDPQGNGLTCDLDAGVCVTTCGMASAACGPEAPCCAGSGGRTLECVQGACAQCLGAGAPCGNNDTPCCGGTTCQPSGYSYYCQ